MRTSQTSKLLPASFEYLDLDQRMSVLHIGSALGETVNFFSAYRCKLHVVDLFAELPLREGEEMTDDLQQQLEDCLMLPENCQFDLCLFWDTFNYLSPDAISAFSQLLKPHLHSRTRGHGFTVHKLKAPEDNKLYGLENKETIVAKKRDAVIPGYSPHGQGPLKTLLSCFRFERSVLLADGRLELLLKASV